LALKRNGVVVALLVACAMAAALVSAASATALDVRSNTRDHLVAADLTVTLASEDPTGTVLIIVDGAVRSATQALPGQVVSLENVDMPSGSHNVVAALRTTEGLSYSDPLRLAIWDAPMPPVMVTPAGYSGATVPVAVKVGMGTSTLSLRVDGKLIVDRAVAPGSLASMGIAELGPGLHTFEFVASNPVAQTKATFQVRRLDYPWPTCIVIDKSDFRLYWIRDGVLAESYPVAIGKAHTPTPTRVWRIDAKYMTDPVGVYGPRKMRLFQQTSWGYSFTAYGIHGTNEPWVIGTMASHGCIRLNNSDILDLFPQVPLGIMCLTRE
jgi:lipoprotein-anchoring transpeptidase ErfK/SrfK